MPVLWTIIGFCLSGNYNLVEDCGLFVFVKTNIFFGIIFAFNSYLKLLSISKYHLTAFVLSFSLPPPKLAIVMVLVGLFYKNSVIKLAMKKPDQFKL